METEPSKKDLEALSYCFREAVFWDSFGYVLLGHKPCAIGAYKKPSWNPLSWIECLSPHNLKRRKGWAVWRKYEKKFPHDRFLFIEEDSPWTNSRFIILIHKEKFLKKVAELQKDFKNVIDCTDGAQILKDASIKPLLSSILKNHDGLIGSLLGYGRENAWAFHNKSSRLQPFIDQEELLQIGHLETEQPDLIHMPLPGFMADFKNPETQELKSLYENDRNQIIEFYQGRNFLDATLELLSR